MRRFFNAVRLLLTLHCDESEQLISRAMDERLPPVERWALRLHFMSCWSCRRVRQQLAVIRRTAQTRGQLLGTTGSADGIPEGHDPSDCRLSEETRRQIQAALRAAASQPDDPPAAGERGKGRKE